MDAVITADDAVIAADGVVIIATAASGGGGGGDGVASLSPVLNEIFTLFFMYNKLIRQNYSSV